MFKSLNRHRAKTNYSDRQKELFKEFLEIGKGRKMIVYKKTMRSYVTCEAIEISEEDILRYENEEVELKELFNDYEDKMAEENRVPEVRYEDREYEVNIDYSLSEI